MKKWYEELFMDYAKQYDKEIFTKGTEDEVDFIEKEIDFNKNTRILDVGCGTGRHSIELSKKGYNVVGIDLSESQLRRAKEKASKEKVDIEFIKQDARKLKFTNEFDLAIMLCEGAFSLMETDQMNFQILENVTGILKEKSKFIFTCLNALYPLYHNVKEFLNKNESSGTSTEENKFDIMTFRESSIYKVKDDKGKEKVLHCDQRYFTPSEIRWYLQTLGYSKIDIFGSDIGVYDRNRKLTPNDFEMLVVAEK